MVTKAQEKRIAAQLDKPASKPETLIERHARLRAEMRALNAEAEKAGVSLKAERKLASGPANGALLSVELAETEAGEPCVVFTAKLADGTKESGDGRSYLLNLSGSEVMDIPGLGRVTLGSLWMLEGEPAKKAAK